MVKLIIVGIMLKILIIVLWAASFNLIVIDSWAITSVLTPGVL